jgi:hypothetical protein
MEPFAFHPELFELRERVLEALADHGYAWLSHYGSVDLMHDVFGLEVCGVPDEDDVAPITQLLRALFPDWPYTRSYYKEEFTREPGWKVIIHRDPENFDDNWEHVG